MEVIIIFGQDNVLVMGLSLETFAGNLLLARVCEMLLGRDDVLVFALAISAFPVSFACFSLRDHSISIQQS